MGRFGDVAVSRHDGARDGVHDTRLVFADEGEHPVGGGIGHRVKFRFSPAACSGADEKWLESKSTLPRQRLGSPWRRQSIPATADQTYS